MIRRMLRRCLFLMQLDHLTRRFHRDRILILMYHGFLAEPTQSTGLEPHGDVPHNYC